MLQVRNSLMLRETLTSDVAKSADRPIVRAVALAMRDAPKPDEIVVVMAVADGGRLHPRCGQAPR
jgi:hypothetical protein